MHYEYKYISFMYFYWKLETKLSGILVWGEFVLSRELFLNRKVNVVGKKAEDFQREALFSFGNRLV